MHVTDPLPDVPWLNGLFVKADRMEVASRFRGAMARDPDDPDANEVYEVSGEDARVDLLFGPEMNLFKSVPPPLVEITEKTFELTGYARVSTVRSNPSWTFVEQHMDLEGEQYVFDDWLGVPNIRIWSLDGFFDPRRALGYDLYTGEQFPEVYGGPWVREGFSYHDEGTYKRWVEFGHDIDEGTSFRRRGRPMWFEDTSHYDAKKRRDRMRRAILFEILEKLGIDGISVFGRRELDDPLFYTTRIKGQPCDIYLDERRRWNELMQS